MGEGGDEAKTLKKRLCHLEVYVQCAKEIEDSPMREEALLLKCSVKTC